MCQFVPSTEQIQRSPEVSDPLVLLNMDSEEEYLDLFEPYSDDEYHPQAENNNEPNSITEETENGGGLFRTVHFHSTVNGGEEGEYFPEGVESEPDISTNHASFHREFLNHHRRSLNRRLSALRNYRLHCLFKRSLKNMKKSGRLFRRALKNHRKSRRQLERSFRMFLDLNVCRF